MDNTVKEKERMSNLEILRIISMIAIICFHYVTNNGIMRNVDFSFNKIIATFFAQCGIIGVNCFILISGYFLVDSTFKVKKLLKLILETFFYSITIMVIYKIFNFGNLSIVQIIKSIFPIIFYQYWFITTYVFMYILSPYINKILELDRKKIIIFLIILLIILSIIPIFTMSSKLYNDLLWFVLLYCIGAYIKKYNLPKKIDKRGTLLILFIITYLIAVTIEIILSYLGTKYPILGGHSNYFRERWSTILLFAAIFLFGFFIKYKCKSIKFINMVSSTTLGIYLIHENPVIKYFITDTIFKRQTYYYSSYFLLNLIIYAITIFSVSVIIDLLRQNILEKNVFKLKFVNKLVSKLEKIFN